MMLEFPNPKLEAAAVMSINIVITLARRLFALVILATALTACGSKSDINNLQVQIDGLKAEAASNRASIDESLSAAQAAEARAAAAEAKLKAMEARVVAFETLCKPIAPPKKR